MYLNQVATVARLSRNSNDNDKEMYAQIATVSINVQPATPELSAVSDGVYGEVSRAFVTYSGVQVGDRITISGTNKAYIVKGVNDWNYAPIPHLELVLFKGDA